MAELEATVQRSCEPPLLRPAGVKLRGVGEDLGMGWDGRCMEVWGGSLPYPSGGAKGDLTGICMEEGGRLCQPLKACEMSTATTQS